MLTFRRRLDNNDKYEPDAEAILRPLRRKISGRFVHSRRMPGDALMQEARAGQRDASGPVEA